MTSEVEFSLDWLAVKKADITNLTIVCYNESLCYPLPWSDENLRGCLEGDYQCFVLQLKSRIIGHMIVQKVLDEIHLHNVCVLPEFQGFGVGHFWLEQLHLYAKQHLVKSIILEVRLSNQIAKSLYLKNGYREIGLRKDYYPTVGGREDAMVMKAQIS